MNVNHSSKAQSKRRLAHLGKKYNTIKNSFEISGDVIQLFVDNDKQIKYALLDLKDFDKVKDHKWRVQHGYIVTTLYYMDNGVKKMRIQSMHRTILGTPPEGKVTDHVNQNKHDNRNINLRFVTQSENIANRKITNPNGANGVYLKKNGKYIAKLMCDGKYVLNKTVSTLSKAINLRNLSEKEYNGEFRTKKGEKS